MCTYLRLHKACLPEILYLDDVFMSVCRELATIVRCDARTVV